MVSKVPEMWLTCDCDRDRIQIPVVPDKYTVSQGSGNESVTIAQLGEITLKGGRKQHEVSWECYFPSVDGQDVSSSYLIAPMTAIAKICRWRNMKATVRFVLTGTNLNGHYTIEDFRYWEEGGAPGIVYYSIKLKEYREVGIRRITVLSGVATVNEPKERVDNTQQPDTYTVVAGDCLWNIAKKLLGDATRWPEIYELNKDVVGSNPNLIYAGQTLTLPE